MEASDGSDHVAERGSGTYVLRDLITGVPLSTDDEGVRARITCVDSWNGNLYIGTSAGEVLHYVSIPPDPGTDDQPSYIFATKLEPAYTTRQEGADAGVKQILILPGAAKACILCNGTLTFNTLPELSPAYGGRIKQAACSWIGGLDSNDSGEDKESSSSPVVVICLRQKLRLIRIGDESSPRKIRDIELPGVTALQRRGDLACVADGQSYSLLDVVNQRKIELFPVSSLTAQEPARTLAPERPVRNREASRSFSSASPVRPGRGHERNISLGAALPGSTRSRPGSTSPWPARGSSRQTGQIASREQSPTKVDEQPSAEPTQTPAGAEEAKPIRLLPPNVASPTANEFLLTTGTSISEPGVGMFVNLDGDVVRGTIEFSSYPESLVLDGADKRTSSVDTSPLQQEGYVLSIVLAKSGDGFQQAIETQRWDVDPEDAQQSREWLLLGADDAPIQEVPTPRGVGLRIATTGVELPLDAVSKSLSLRRLHLRDSEERDVGAEAKQNDEEDRFTARFSRTFTRILLYREDKVYWVLRNALVERLEKQLDQAVQRSSSSELTIDVPRVQRIINSIRGQEPRDELEFLTLTYVRQKASLLLFGNLMLQTANGFISYERDKRFTEEALVAGDIDPRCVLALIPPLSEDLVVGDKGIWLSQGLRDTIHNFRQSFDTARIVQDPKGAYGDNLLNVIKRYLYTWRKKKGFGSVADDEHVFQTVDAALLHLLLMLDQNSPRGPATAGSVRAELNDVVDRGVDCFDRAVELFEQYNRLYMLSRLHQSRKDVAQVLATWRRIMEDGKDAGGELIEGEQDLRRYLAKIRDATLVQEYGSWLANRNPKLGVQVFADDSSRVKFQSAEAVAILKDGAPGAVKDYLEYLVFGKNQVQYVNDLIAFYLDSVLGQLESSDKAKNILLQSYETYRALHPPKPTYRQFITDNAVEEEWWHNRLRLLQLIGGSHGAASKYNVHSLRQRLAPYNDELVPEMIILNGREGKHEEALRLLTHGLGDYDTAIRYCLLGGSSIFHPGSGLAPEQPLPTKDEQARLFEYLLHEFFGIEDLSERLERTAELLERFGGWFDVAKVLAMIPDSWSVEVVSSFLIHAFRRLVRERNETVVVKALSSAQNLRQAVDFIEKSESLGPTIVNATVDAT